MLVKTIKTDIFHENDDLVTFIRSNIKQIKEKTVLVVTSKIVALSEGRTIIVKNKKEKLAIIKRESDAVLQTKMITLTLKDNMLMAAGGVDESNAQGKLILLPKNSYKTSELLLEKIKKIYKVKDLGILITDSRTHPLRRGVTGIATGFAGFCGLRDYVGKPDIFGRKLVFTSTNVADCLATAAVLEMGEANEQRPLALITTATIVFTSKRTNKNSVSIPIEDDLYKSFLRPIIRKMKNKNE